jgi:hypothetical protein
MTGVSKPPEWQAISHCKKPAMCEYDEGSN